MAAFLSILFGVLLVLAAYKLFTMELKKRNEDYLLKYPGISDDNTNVILSEFNRIEELINDMNASYYDLISDLEGKYSIHEKEIELLGEKHDRIQKELLEIKSSLNNYKVQKIINDKEQEINKVKSAASKKGEVGMEGKPIDLFGLEEKEKSRVIKLILELKEEGLVTQQIAKQLNVGVGELQLFLNINNIK